MSMNRRQFSSKMLSVAGLPFLSWSEIERLLAQIPAERWIAPDHAKSYPLYEEALEKVLPAGGYESSISLVNSTVRLVECGVIDRGKFFDLYGFRGPLPSEFGNLLNGPANGKIVLTSANAGHYVNLLWPVGLSNYLAANAESPINGDDLYGFASTGGWNLGKEENGGSYFNRLPIVDLRAEEEARVVRIAKSTFRPCCNNSTFFQDCNHGSALLGLLELGASQGLTDDELYREALAFNSFWFPREYLRTALFFKVRRNTKWADVDPRTVLSFDYSAGGPWGQNVAAQIETIPDLIPPPSGSATGCGV
jgi:hypothetical protein